MTTTNESELNADPELDDGEELDLAESQREILTRPADLPVSTLHQKHVRGRLILQPEFQRHYVWDAKKASRLIESALLRVPLPIIYLSEERDNLEYVIDGQQRLTSLFAFIDGQFPDGTPFRLTGLTVFKDLNKKTFRELSQTYQDRIQDYNLRTVTLLRQSNPDLKFEIFERLNTGSEPLNDMELRNCIYRGPYMSLLRELAADEDFLKLLGLSGPDKRLKDVELVLRFASFFHQTYLNYKSPMKRFYNADMQRYRQITPEDADRLREAFRTSVRNIRSLLGHERAFKRYYPGTDKNPNGRWETQKFNASIFDVLMGTLHNKPQNQIMAAKDALVEGWTALMADNADFRVSIERATSSQDMVTYRFDQTRQLFEGILRQHPTQPRCFTRALKQQLYDANPTCALCGNHIVDLDDAAVDHIHQYWQGGQTIPANARLAHRYCNNARPRKD